MPSTQSSPFPGRAYRRVNPQPHHGLLRYLLATVPVQASLSWRLSSAPACSPVGSPIELRVHHSRVHAGPVGGSCQVVLVDTVFQAIWDPAWEGGRYTGERQQGGLKLLPLQSQEAGPSHPSPQPWVTPHEHHRALST